MVRRFLAIAAAFAAIALDARGQTQVGSSLTYQAELRASGAPAAGPVDLRFRLYDAASAGAQVGPAIDRPGVALSQGRFTQALDFGAAAFGPDARWLEIDVRNPAGSGSYVTLSPRQRVTAAPVSQFAAESGNAATAANSAALNGQSGAYYQNASNLSGGTIPSERLSGSYTGPLSFTHPANTFMGRGTGLTELNASNLTMGTIAPHVLPTPLHLMGTTATCIISGVNNSNADNSAGVCGISTASTGVTYGVFGQSASLTGYGVFGEVISGSGSPSGVYGRTIAAAGRGVYGVAENPSGQGFGVHGLTYGDAGSGVWGRAISSTGVNNGVMGTTLSTNGRGVHGVATALTGLAMGGSFRSDSDSGMGVYALVSATSGTTNAVHAQTLSNAGRGVHGLASATNGTTYGVFGETHSTFGRGVFGLAANPSGPNYGVYGESIGSFGVGVYGEHIATSGTAYGGRFRSRSTGGTAVRGDATALSGTTYGGYFRSDSTTGYGVYASADGGNGLGVAYGVFGDTGMRSGVGVYGRAWDSTTSNNDGVVGESRGTSGRGTVGWATALTGPTFGVWGLSASTSGTGVYGRASALTGTIYGVYGQASTAAAGYAVFANGDMGASGLKPFRIDHPDDPENKYLLHYAAESPEVINFYRGTVSLDSTGGAVVELPAYFAKTNKDPSYQLTAVGAPMPMLHVAVKISEADLSAGAKAGPSEAAPVCSFRISGGAPGGEVSWRVEAIRNDRWVQTRGAPVEVEKRDLEKGTYQHPELYGKPRDLGRDHAATRQHPDPGIPAAEPLPNQ